MKRVPNILSVLRILLAPLFVYMYLQDAFIWATLGMVVFIVAAITDYLDGYYARRFGVTSGLGAFLDPMADKILTFAGFICIPFLDPDQFPWWIIWVIIIRDFLITFLRVWSERKGRILTTRLTAKIKTTLQIVFLYVVLLTGVFVRAGGITGRFGQLVLESGILGWIFVLVMVITVYTAFEYLYINRLLFKRDATSL